MFMSPLNTLVIGATRSCDKNITHDIVNDEIFFFIFHLDAFIYIYIPLE